MGGMKFKMIRMNAKKRWGVRSAGALCLLPGLLVGGIEPAAAQQPGKPAACAVRFVSTERLTQPRFHLVTAKGEELGSLAIASWDFSDEVEVPAGVTVYLCGERPVSIETIPTVAMASFRCKQGQEEAYGVIIPGAAHAGKKEAGNAHTCHLIDANRASFRGGDKMVFNLSRFHVAFHFDKTQTRISSGKGARFGAPGAPDGTLLPVTGKFLKGKEWRTFLDSRWMADSRFRSLIFVYDNQRGTYPKLHSISARLLEKKDKKRSR